MKTIKLHNREFNLSLIERGDEVRVRNLSKVEQERVNEEVGLSPDMLGSIGQTVKVRKSSLLSSANKPLLHLYIPGADIKEDDFMTYWVWPLWVLDKNVLYNLLKSKTK